MPRRNALVALLVLGSTSFAFAQAEPAKKAMLRPVKATTESPIKETKQTIGDWVVACAQKDGSPKTCALSQTLSQTQTGRFLSSLSIGRDASGKSIGNITAPLGFAVNKGGQLQIGDASPITLEFVTCVANGCLSIVEFSATEISEMQAASKLRVTIESLQKKPVNIEFSMNGFPKALAAYVQEVKN
ncbi:invasion associated locus B family protein [Hyphomicrobium sp. 99]|uniref:invasion associated locus B family protein n=1 Tax=Hyphomicrobium sp. 99 TaxID=1163419 RepID=UPI0005F8762F|nr:invasion-associated locus B family protein [Hyphomicrobium sp. 99]